MTCLRISTIWILASAICPPSVTGVEPVAADPFIVGVCTHLSKANGLDAHMSLMRQAGIGSFRSDVGWSRMETEKGVLRMPPTIDEYVQSAAAAGIRSLLILDYGNRFYDDGGKPVSEEALGAFTRYAEFVVRHFKGKVWDYEVWNEWDGKTGRTAPETPERYVRLLQAVYPRIKAIDPSIRVYGGAMMSASIRNGWMEKMLAAGALRHLDAVSIHTYIYGRPGRERSPETWATWMNEVQSLIAKHNDGRPVPLYVTEMGWPTQTGERGTLPRVSAAYLARRFLLARTMPWMKGIWWYDLMDDGWQPEYNEHNFGIVRPDLTPKPSYFTLSDISGLTARGEFVRREATSDPDIWILKFRFQRNDAWVIWSAHDDGEWQVSMQTTAKDPKPIQLLEVGARAIERPWGAGNPAALNRIDLLVQGTPWLITGSLEGASVMAVKRREAPPK